MNKKTFLLGTMLFMSGCSKNYTPSNISSLVVDENLQIRGLTEYVYMNPAQSKYREEQLRMIIKDSTGFIYASEASNPIVSKIKRDFPDLNLDTVTLYGHKTVNQEFLFDKIKIKDKLYEE
jgi:hypothetical protein